MKNAFPALIAWLCLALPGSAAEIPPHAEGLRETLISVALSETSRQQGVLSVKTEAVAPSHLAVLLPGYPAVVRPIVESGHMVRSKQTGNFLIRSRRFLASESIATLIVDCPTDSGDECKSFYQSSEHRLADVAQLVAAARRELPSVQRVWLIGTSMGTISSAFLALRGGAHFHGAIHTATMTQNYIAGAFRELIDFDYGAIAMPQALVHHRDDACRYTPHAEAVEISRRFGIPLLTVHGGGEFTGPPCEAYSQHGFKGMEATVMRAIAKLMLDGKAVSQDIHPKPPPANASAVR